MGAKIALIAACYRLGDLDSLRHLIFLLQEVTDPLGDDAHFVLQTIENLATFKTPARLFSDVPSFLEPLRTLTERMPIWRASVTRIQEQLVAHSRAAEER